MTKTPYLKMLVSCCLFSSLWAFIHSLPFFSGNMKSDVEQAILGAGCGAVYGGFLGLVIESHKLKIRSIAFRVIVVSVILGTIGAVVDYHVDIRERRGARTDSECIGVAVVSGDVVIAANTTA